MYTSTVITRQISLDAQNTSKPPKFMQIEKKIKNSNPSIL